MDKHFNFHFSKCTTAIIDRQETDFQMIGFAYWNFCNETMDSFRRIQPYYSLLYVVSGIQYIEVNNVTYSVKANEVFIMPKDIPFRSYPDPNDPPSHVAFEFTGTFAASYLENIGFTLQNIKQKCPHPKSIREALKTLIMEIQKNEAFSYYAVLSAFFSVLSAFSNPQNNIHSLKEDTFISNIKNFINTHCLNTNFSIDEITTNFFISHSYLCKKFKQQTGETVTSYINERRMLNAEHLLKTTTLSATEIATMSGYTCYPYFITRFKERHGFTTREYRKQLEERSKDKKAKKKRP